PRHQMHRRQDERAASARAAGQAENLRLLPSAPRRITILPPTSQGGCHGQGSDEGSERKKETEGGPGQAEAAVGLQAGANAGHVGQSVRQSAEESLAAGAGELPASPSRGASKAPVPSPADHMFAKVPAHKRSRC